MIKSKNGKTVLKGEINEILADFVCIGTALMNLLEENHGEKDAVSLFSHAIDLSINRTYETVTDDAPND